MARAGDGNSGRRRRARGTARTADDGPARAWSETSENGPDGEFSVRRVSGGSGDKVYRCPGCDQEIRAGIPHVVAWPDGRLDDRRHWHSACWAKRAHRAPTVQRSRNAPRL